MHDAGHDYEVIRQKGFAKLVIEENAYMKLYSRCLPSMT